MAQANPLAEKLDQLGSRGVSLLGEWLSALEGLT